MGKSGAGAVMFLVSLFGLILAGVPTGLMHLIGIIEGVIYLIMSEERFDETYIRGPRAWF